MTVSHASLAGGAGVRKWVADTTYGLDAVVWSPINKLTYVRLVAGAGATDPSADDTNWALLGPSRRKGHVQRGTVLIAGGAGISATYTISAVNPAKARLRYGGFTVSGGTNIGDSTGVRLTLTNATTVTATREDTSLHDTRVSFEVEEEW